MRVASLAALLLLLLGIGLILKLLPGIYKNIFQIQIFDEWGVDEDDQDNFNPELQKCLRYHDPSDILRCAQNVKDHDKISHEAITGFLRQLMDKIDSKEMSSDARLSSLGLTPSPNFCRESHYVDVSPLRTKRPVLLYVVGIVPDLRDWSNRPARPQRLVRGSLFPAFSSNPSRFRANTDTNCTGYHDWVKRNLYLWSESAADLKAAIVMNGKLWCPKSFITAAKVAIVDLYEDDVKLTEHSCERVYKINWALWRKGSYGIVPKKFEHIFL